jgi:hypothetical protein
MCGLRQAVFEFRVFHVCICMVHQPKSWFGMAADVLAQYEQTGQLPNGGLAGAIASAASPKKRGKKPKLNKDGSEKQPRKPTAYNAWMQAKVQRSTRGNADLSLHHMSKALDERMQ